MSLKKMQCLLLAVVMVFAMAACGKDENKQQSGGDNTTTGGNQSAGGSSTTEPNVTEPSPEDLGPWIVTEEVDYLGSVYRYHYDENGELTSYELCNKSGEKLRDYKPTSSATEAGGKLLVVESKHVKDSKYAKDREMEYDAAGNLIRITNFVGQNIMSESLYTYDQDGNLLTYKRMGTSTCTDEASYTYTDGVLTTASGKKYAGESVYPYDYSYFYGDNGYLNEIRFNVSGVGEGTITLGKDISRSEGGLHVLTHSAHSMEYQNLFSYEAELDAEGNRSKFTLNFRRWGFEPFFALPLPGYGSMMSGWNECDGSITYTRLDVYLAENA